jgi:tetrapyrrole methylase family protein/MazG family protein
LIDAYTHVNAILDRLLAPDGCPWDREQTLQSLRTTVLEEVCELIEAIDLDDNRHIQEELGDLFLNFIFFCKIAEKEQRFTQQAVLKGLADKLIRRHPHIFGDAKVEDAQAVVHQWEAIKSAEAHNSQRTNVLDGIPKGLPALARAQKVCKRLMKAGYAELPEPFRGELTGEEELGQLLLAIVRAAQAQGLDAEQALRSCLAQHEQRFRKNE